MLASWLRTGLKLMYFVWTIYSLHKWCHKLYPTDLAGGLPKLLIQPGDLWPLLGPFFLGYLALWRFREKQAAWWGSFSGPTVRLSGSRGHTARGEALNEFMFSFLFFPPHTLSLSFLCIISCSHPLLKLTRNSETQSLQSCKCCLLLII